MPIKYRAVLRPEPGVEGGGERKYYASLVLGDEVTVDLLVKQIEKFCTLTRPDIVAVIAALESVVEYELCQSVWFVSIVWVPYTLAFTVRVCC